MNWAGCASLGREKGISGNSIRNLQLKPNPHALEHLPGKWLCFLYAPDSACVEKSMDQHVMAPNAVMNYAAVVSHTQQAPCREGAPHHRILRLRTALPGAGMAQPLLQHTGEDWWLYHVPSLCSQSSPNQPQREHEVHQAMFSGIFSEGVLLNMENPCEMAA